MLHLQREAVHPLNEAKGYKLVMEKDSKVTTADMALNPEVKAKKASMTGDVTTRKKRPL